MLRDQLRERKKQTKQTKKKNKKKQKEKLSTHDIDEWEFADHVMNEDVEH
ncbi:hypothetical protein ACQCVL_08675 [Bacillus thuringiensis]